MRHLGDITKLSGDMVPAVDVITGGSPCQNLSVAGNRKGLAGNESGLFLEQMRLIREMRYANGNRTNGPVRGHCPRFLIWENVKGAFSCSGGEDFRRVLEEIARVRDPNAVIPRPPNGRWPYAGAVVATDWSLAWRLHDAQFWGVPQRRTRIAVVADFGGTTAPEILFERTGVRGDIEPGETSGQNVAPAAGTGVNGAISFVERGGKPGGGKGILIRDEQAATLSVTNAQAVATFGEGAPIAETVHATQTPICAVERSPALSAQAQIGVCVHGGEPADGALVLNDQGGAVMSTSIETTGTLRASEHGHGPCCLDRTAIPINTMACFGRRDPKNDARMCLGIGEDGDPADTLSTAHSHAVAELYANEGLGKWKPAEATTTIRAAGGDLGGGSENLAVADDVAGAILSRDYKGAGNEYAENGKCVVPPSGRVRRLTPLECTRLQGFPDYWLEIGDWTDTKGRLHRDSDGPKYKALGNSIALPFWDWLAERIVAVLKADGIEEPRMASLFDGIGGFPFVFRKHGCTPVWASEIEEFPIAVTKIRFPEPKNERRNTTAEGLANVQPGRRRVRR